MTATTTSGAATGILPSGTLQAGLDLRIERIEGAASLLARVEALVTSAAVTAFQTPAWIFTAATTLAVDLGATPLALEVRDARRGAPLLLLPLAIRTSGGVREATFLDFGVADYNAPLILPGCPSDAAFADQLWGEVARALGDVDLIRFERLPASVGGLRNPLAVCRAARRSRFSRNAIVLQGSIGEFVASRGKRFRKEAGRCGRVLARNGTPVFRRAATADEIARGYATLTALQEARQERAGNPYLLSEPHFDRFYRELLRTGSDRGFAHLFTLEVEGEIVATLFGVSYGTTFKLLRISHDNEKWGHASPGRLIVLETMNYFIRRKVKRFDMGIGDYTFKRQFGAEPEPLAEVVVARTWRGVPHVASERSRAFIRAHPGLHRLARRLAGRE
jgi:CelD/BcsL family acetyltransferase involved in cellulose biosynthesis